MALMKLETTYPKTKAAEEARKVREQVQAEITKWRGVIQREGLQIDVS